ncbi:sodium-dependent glucose transporter 1A-like [Glandiceps talaboti]
MESVTKSTQVDFPDHGSCEDTGTLQEDSIKENYLGNAVSTKAILADQENKGISISLTGPTLPDLQLQVGATLQEISLIITFWSIGCFIGSFFSGVTLDEIQNYLVLALASFVSSFYGLSAWTVYLAGLCALRFITGIANGYVSTGINAVCLRLWHKSVGPYMQALHFSFAIGGTIGPLIAAPFLSHVDTNATMTTIAPTLLPEAIELRYPGVPISQKWYLFSLQEESKVMDVMDHHLFEGHGGDMLEAHRQEKHNLYGLSEFAVLADSYTDDNETETSSPTLWVPYTISGVMYLIAAIPFLVLFLNGNRKVLHKNDNMLSTYKYMPDRSISSDNMTGESRSFRYILLSILAIMYFMIVSHEVVYNSYAYTFAIESGLGFTSFTASYLTSAYWASFAASRGISVLVASRLSPVKMITLLITGVTIATSMLAIWGGSNEIVLWVGTILLGASIAPCYPTGISWTGKQIVLSGKATSIFTTAASATGIIDPLILGALFDTYGIGIMMYTLFAFSVGLIISFAMAVLFVKYFGPNRHRHNHTTQEKVDVPENY